MTPTGQTITELRSLLSKDYTPHDYQKWGISLMVRQACAGLLLPPGLGKTSISLAAATLLGSEEYIRAVLIIAPLRAVYNVWPAEIKKWKDFNHLSIGILHGDAKDAVLRQDHNIYVINPEGLEWLFKILIKKKKEYWPFDMLIVDESTKFKRTNTKRFKMMRRLVKGFKRRYILTGTPMPNGLIDLFGQIYILDEGNALGSYITHYRNTYFYPGGYGGYDWLPQADAMERITARIEPLVLSLNAEDYLQLPTLVNDIRWYTLPQTAREIYTELEDNFITIIEDQDLMAPSAAAAGVKCRQILNGAVYINRDKDWLPVHDTKLTALEELVEELSGEPLLVLYEFQHDKERILSAFPNCAMIGGQSMKKDQVVIEGFNRGSIPMVLGHPASMGHALNLQGNCAHVCWFGLTWNLEHYDQAIKRVWRQGNDAPRVIIHHLCVRDSLDEVVIGTLASKEKDQNSFVRGIQALAKGRKKVYH